MAPWGIASDESEFHRRGLQQYAVFDLFSKHGLKTAVCCQRVSTFKVQREEEGGGG
ncbi:unnamed protein product, partial [Lampetra fluviatilis]